MLLNKSRFYKLLHQHIVVGYIKEGDSIMADKGFTIGSVLKTIGLHLDLPLFVSSGTQMSQSSKTKFLERQMKSSAKFTYNLKHTPPQFQGATGLNMGS